MTRITRLTRSAAFTAAPIALLLCAAAAGAQHDDHDRDQEHAEVAPADDHDREADHHDEPADAHESHEGHDEHGDEDEHQDDEQLEEGVIHITDAMMEEFGIVVAPAGPGTLDQQTRLPGEIVFNADRVAHVTPNVAGIVQSVSKSVGDRVEAGEVMAILHSQALAEARSRYLAAAARLELARQMLTRDERLFNDRIGTERQVLESQQTVREAEIDLNLTEQGLHALGQDHAQIGALGSAEDTSFSAYELRAPLTGVVTERHLTRGEMVTEDPDEAPFVVADLSSVWCNLTIYQRDLAVIRPGMTVHISAGEDSHRTQGTIAFVSPALDEATRTATARVVLDNPDGWWRPGMFVSANIATSSTQSDLVLPRSALQEVQGEPAVFVQSAEGFEVRHVTIGRETADAVEIVEGLEPGERVVVRNAFALIAEINRGALEHAGHAH